jgi:Arm DNA-binding domain
MASGIECDRTPDRRQTDKRGFKTKREAQAWAN